MTKKRMFLGIGLAAALAVPAVAVAWPDGEGRRAKMMEKFDANGDGAIDDAEREAMKQARQARRAEMLAKYDADKDGTLSDAEHAKMRLDHATQRFQALDVNKDGALSFDEFKAGAERGHGFGHHRGGKR
jgi:Ca2+-binding EF-hand superfamily protein